MKKILPVFSYVFHPLFIPLMAVAAFLFLGDNYLGKGEKLLIVLQVTIMTVLIPVAFFFLLKTLGKIDSVMASDVGQRKLPLAIQTILLLLLFSQSLTRDRVPELFFFFSGAALSSLTALFFTVANAKPSLHTAASGAMLVFFIGLSIHYGQNLISLIAITFAINGLIATSRLEMEAHTLREIIVGFIIGIVPQMLLWKCWL